MKVKFTKSPVGAFKLAYVVNDEAELNDELAAKVISAGYAVEVKEIETAVVQNIETPETKKKRK